MRRTLAVVLLAACCLAATAGLAAGVHEESTDDTLAIELTADGNAAVHHITTYNLSAEDEQSAYEAISTNETARADHREETMSDLEAAAATGRNGTDLDMRVRDPSVDTYERNGTGFVSVTVTWENLAYYNETMVVVTEPFRSGYEPDRDVTIHGPEGYRRGVTQPPPGIARLNSAAWSVESDFSNFYAAFNEPEGSETATATEPTTAAPPDDGLEGVGTFLWALTLAALPVVALLVALRRRE
ncbi:hypothetical protein HWV23_08540 [Natronomonas halophila]|uniref:DUF7345 domain-containing protein n=1 Tax=Natronomonas halophila TaxID=2747817 RepID=UPI0015B68859|nr:hypothetical protein [Natronomonas halophila]QLD85766.1 hypothetical protein HWV23_08540 [Natronomonas halophila]